VNWVTEWRAIADRINGMERATELYLQSQRVTSNDAYGASRKHLLPAYRNVFDSIFAFYNDHYASLPANAETAIRRFISDNQGFFGDASLVGVEVVVYSITALVGFRAEMQYHLSDVEAVALRLAERAVAHLQRQIVVDKHYGDRWRAAFSRNEPACEELGSVHLLQHGIWAFKVSATGERTDLVLAEPVVNLNDIAGAAEALVLTEWKLVRSETELEAKIAQARRQADLYSVGSLGGVELRSHRYIIVVSNDRLRMPPDDETGDVRYRHRNIAVDPATPSKQTV
jgi:hypothetical protein